MKRHVLTTALIGLIFGAGVAAADEETLTGSGADARTMGYGTESVVE